MTERPHLHTKVFEKREKNRIVYTIYIFIYRSIIIFLNKKNYADGRKLIDNNCSVALATDFNPGTCTIRSLSNIMLLAMQHCGLSLEEAFLGVTLNAAKSINKENEIGT